MNQVEARHAEPPILARPDAPPENPAKFSPVMSTSRRPGAEGVQEAHCKVDERGVWYSSVSFACILTELVGRRSGRGAIAGVSDFELFRHEQQDHRHSTM